MKTLKQKIEVMQAADDGKGIEVNFGQYWEGWENMDDAPDFNWGQNDYRVKPEPLEMWIFKYATGKCVLCQTEREAQEYDDATTDSKVFKVREVTE